MEKKAPTMSGDAPLGAVTEFELERMLRIRRNAEKMRALGLSEAVASLKMGAALSAQKETVASKATTSKSGGAGAPGSAGDGSSDDSDSGESGEEGEDNDEDDKKFGAWLTLPLSRCEGKQEIFSASRGRRGSPCANRYGPQRRASRW